MGWGTTEARRGALGHWLNIQNGKVENYNNSTPPGCRKAIKVLAGWNVLEARQVIDNRKFTK